VHSLNILVKYVRLYGFEHKRTETQFETTWSELQQALPNSSDGSFVLGVSDNKLLMDGIPMETGQAERSFAQLLTVAGLASISFSKQVSVEDFARLVRAFAVGGSKAQDIAKSIKQTFGDSSSAIRINEVKFVAADPVTGEISVAAQIAAQNLGPEFRDWLNDPQKLLQLIAAAEGAKSGGTPGGAPIGTVPNIPIGGGGGNGPGGGGPGGGGPGGGGPGGGGWNGGVVPLQEEEVIQAIRLLTRFGQTAQDPQTGQPILERELSQTDPNTRLNLQQLLEGLASNVKPGEDDTPLLMKAAEHMAIRFALERYQKGEVKVNAVHQMLEHMSRQMDTLRQILKIQEDKMNKAGLLVESHADILDRMFWSEVPEAGKKSVLLSHEAACVPPRNIRQFIEVLLDRGDKETSAAILKNYVSCLESTDSDARQKTAVGLSQIADLYSLTSGALSAAAIRKVAEVLAKESAPELQSLLSAAFVRLGSEASSRKQFDAISEVCASMDLIARERPTLANDLRPRVGIENRLPEFVEEALRMPQISQELLEVLRRTSQPSVEHIADRFFRCMRRDECDRMVELMKELGPPALQELREMLRKGQPRQAASAVGLLSRLDVPSMLELLPSRLPEFNRFYHDVVVRQIAYGASFDRAHSLLELLDILDPLILPQAVDEIGMSGDKNAVPPLIVMAEAGETRGRSPYLQLKAVESLGRLRENDAIPVLRGLLEARRRWKWSNHRELRIAAAQALVKIDPRYGSQVLADSGLEASELAIAPLDAAPACPWVRQRRYERIVLPRTLSAGLSSSWGKSSILIRELSLGGGMGTKEDNLRIGSEANLEIAIGVRKIRAQVLLRRARVNEIGFEIVNSDLESRYRLRRLLIDALGRSPETKQADWDGDREM
jgi:hypothetical protein